MKHQIITTQSELEQLCGDLAGAESIAFDTEFVSEHTYRPTLCLVQVAAGRKLAVIDPLDLQNLTPFWKLLAQPGHDRETTRAALPLLCQGLEDEEWSVRFECVAALRTIAGQHPAQAVEALPALVKAFQSGDRIIQQYAAKTLGSLGPAGQAAGGCASA